MIEEKIEQGLFFISELLPYMPQVTEITIKVWVVGLRKYTPEQIEFGFDHFIQTLTSEYKSSRHTPMPGDIGKIIDEFFQAGWAQAWQQVYAYATGPGITTPQEACSNFDLPVISDPMVKRALERIGGVSEIAKASNERIPIIRAQFRDIYSSEVKQAQLGETALFYGLEPGRQNAVLQFGEKVISFPVRSMPDVVSEGW